MEIRDRKLVEPGAPLRRGAAPAAAPAAGTATGARDQLSIAGLSETDLTPKVRQALMTLLAEVDQLRRELGEARSRILHLEKMVDEDPMMPVANRRAFVRELTRMMAYAQRYNAPASIIYFDVNNLKHINDTLGHGAGDAALLQLAQVLVENVRTTDVVGRLGGDEMGVLLMQTDQAVAERKAAELAATITANPVEWQGKPLPLTVAYGVFSFAGRETVSEIIAAADQAMYRAKRKTKAQPVE